MQKLRLQDLDLKGKKVLMRVDFNVPLKEGTITDDTRIREALPSIEYVLKSGGSVILMSHLGRPKNGPDPQLSLKPCAPILSQLLNKKVLVADDCIGEHVETMARQLQPSQVLLLENLRFYPAEENPSSDPLFAKKLAALGDLYVNDAFGTAHRSHSSTATIAQYFPHRAAAGLLMQKEIQFLSQLLSHPKHPFYAIIGGAKISTKMGILKSLVSKVDGIFIGGGMAFTFFKAQGYEIGDSICEEEQISTAASFLKMCSEKKIPCYLPQDNVIAEAFRQEAQTKTILVPQEGIPKGWQGMDIGPQTIQIWKKALQQAATVFWNGPLGVFEFPAFAKGTEEIAKLVANLNAITVVGGGDSVAAINRLGLMPKFTHVSTGGGASLEYIELGHLPGIDALSNK
jgi:phosphoglycerate kinase